MLIEFRFSNFRSFKDEGLLTLVAAQSDELSDSNVVKAEPTSQVPDILRSAVIYGANGSGKSNLVAAMQFFQHFVLTSANQSVEGQDIQVTPFRLDPKFANQPTEFEVTFEISRIRYQYGFRLNRRIVIEEWLFVYKTARAQQWFRRAVSDANVPTYKFSSHLGGLKNVWQAATRGNALFLSTAVLLNSESLRPVFGWITGALHIGLQMQVPLSDLSPSMAKDAGKKKALLKLLAAADLSIADVQVEQRKGTQIDFGAPTADGELAAPRISQLELEVPRFLHRVDGYEVLFEPHDESVGTQKLFALAGLILDSLSRGAALVLDELDSSLHVLIMRFIVSLFHSKDTNPKGAQLIFTTHNVMLLDRDIFRRDQFWLVERDEKLRSRIFPLSDFAPRKDESIMRGYLSGKYGAVPILSKYAA